MEKKMDQNIEKQINSNHAILEYDKGYKDGLIYEWKKTHDYVTGTTRSPMSPIDLKLIEEKMFSENKNSESYMDGFKSAQEEYYKYSPDEQVQIVSRIRR